MKKHFWMTALTFACALLLHFGCSVAQLRARIAVSPETDALFTSTRNATGLIVDREGALWAATISSFFEGNGP